MTNPVSTISLTQLAPISVPNEVANNYALNFSLIETGSYSSVYKSRDLQTNSPVAIKIQTNSLAARTEAAVLSTLDCCHTARCRKVIVDAEDGDKHYIVMDLIREKSIFKAFLTSKNPTVQLKFDEIVSITRQVLEVLKVLDKRKTIFFDLNDENLIFQRPSRALTVIDFGAARKTNEQNDLIVTLNNAAPEFFLGSQITTAFDLWSLGCTVFSLLTGADFIPTPKRFSKLSKKEIRNSILQMIVNRIGKPTPEYLQNCRRAGLYLDENQEFKKKVDLPLKNWIEAVREAAPKYHRAQEDVEEFIPVLGRLLCYENRATAAKLLTHPIFKREIAVTLVFDPNVKCKMEIYRESILPEAVKSLDELPLGELRDPDLTLDFNESTPSCLHIPRDPNRKYLIVLRDGDKLEALYYGLAEGDMLNINDQQEDLVTKVNGSDETVSDEEELGEPPPKKTKTDEN